MLRITPQQMSVFVDEARRQSCTRIVTRLEALLPLQTSAFGHVPLLSLCDRAAFKADSYQMGSEQGTLAYCAAMLLFNEDFDTNPNYPWTRDVLPITNMDESLKWRLLTLRIKMDTGELVY